MIMDYEPEASHGPWQFTKGLSRNNRSTLARAPGGQMRGAATQAMLVYIVEERQRSRCLPAAAPLAAAAAGRSKVGL
jgi:hypothetical protein